MIMAFNDGDVVKSFVYTKSIELQKTNVQVLTASIVDIGELI